MKDLYAAVSMPGEDGKAAFVLEIGKDNGDAPRPIDVVYLTIQVLKDVIKKTEVGGPASDPNTVILEMLAMPKGIEEVPLEEHANFIRRARETKPNTN